MSDKENRNPNGSGAMNYKEVPVTEVTENEVRERMEKNYGDIDLHAICTRKLPKIIVAAYTQLPFKRIIPDIIAGIERHLKAGKEFQTNKPNNKQDARGKAQTRSKKEESESEKQEK